jgi:hypothetical protein
LFQESPSDGTTELFVTGCINSGSEQLYVLRITLRSDVSWADQVNWVQNKAAKFAHHKNDSNKETLAQRRKIPRICPLFKAYKGERAWKAIG